MQHAMRTWLGGRERERNRRVGDLRVGGVGVKRLELQHAVGDRLRECAAQPCGDTRRPADHDTLIERGVPGDDDLRLA